MLQLQRRPLRPVDAMPVSPPAQRGSRARWRDPRLLLGVVLVFVAMAAGALILGSRPSGVPVLRTADNLPAGIALTPEDFEISVVDLPDGSTYLNGLPDGTLVLAQPLNAGEFVASTDFVVGPGADVRLVTVPVDTLHAPISLASGARVDVWATATSEGAVPTLVMRDALVAATSADTESSTGQLGVVLEVPTADAGAVVAATHAGSVDLVALPEGSAR